MCQGRATTAKVSVITYLQDKELVVEDRSCTSHGQTISSRFYPDHTAKVHTARIVYFINRELSDTPTR